MPRYRINSDGLYAALDQQRAAQQLSWRSLADELQVSPSTFSRLKIGHRPDADGLLSILVWLGVLTIDLSYDSRLIDDAGFGRFRYGQRPTDTSPGQA